MKKIIALSAFAIVGSLNAATLDVKGDIKINGKIVIDATGQIITANSIDMTVYKKSAVGHVTLTATKSEELAEGENKLTISKIIVSNDGINNAEHDYTDGKLDWAGEWFEGQKSRYFNGWSKCGTHQIMIGEGVYTPMPAIEIGKTASSYNNYQRIETDLCTGEAKTVSHEEVDYQTLLAQSAFDNGQFKFDDCIIVEHERAWGRLDIKTFCKGVGLVEMIAGYKGSKRTEYTITDLSLALEGFVLTHTITEEPEL